MVAIAQLDAGFPALYFKRLIYGVEVVVPVLGDGRERHILEDAISGKNLGVEAGERTNAERKLGIDRNVGIGEWADGREIAVLRVNVAERGYALAAGGFQLNGKCAACGIAEANIGRNAYRGTVAH